ncbi:TRAP transporter small permease [Orrella marina]|uniref:TRAP transporter small permease protein n=1 Tax=Orrella marina TaxID=2163011 RepID=A0A2R4XG77_9BURK|nr:TRAP transporter small permease subunit [Orrella marina]AWB32785.1 TRAP transporter small permease [Orrella marina]
MNKLHGVLDRFVQVLENIGAVIAGSVLLFCMVLVSFDALLRYAFAAPLTFQLHLTQYYLLVLLTMLGLSWGYRSGGSIQITFLVNRLPENIRGLVARAGLLASSAYVAVLAVKAWEVFERAWVRDTVVMGVIDWPVAWSWIWVPIGCALLSTRLLLDATASRLRVMGGAH